MTSRVVAIARKKDLLLAQKHKLIANIKFSDKKIEEVLQNRNHFYQNDDSSDSDNGLTVPQNTGPSSRQLSVQQSQLSICLQATQELSRLEVLQSEVDLVDPPQLRQGEEPSEPGLWREVTAECRVDLVPFLITFHFYTPSRKFAPLSYHNLTVKPVKVAHEKELSKSVLSDVITPSDAVQIIRSYAEVNRSRRTTLATLDQKYDGLVMEALPEGGYLLKCANLLELSWTLENKWSPIAPFTHRLKFDLEYMDESYIKILRNVHKQLSDPSIDTDERTHLLAQFLDVVSEASGAISNMESDTDSVNKTRTTLDQEPEMPETRKKAEKNKPIAPRNKIAPKNKDLEVMAPPKQLPKKSKGKENVANAQAVNKTSYVAEIKRSAVKRPLESNEKISKDPIKSKVVENGGGDVASKKSKLNEVNIDGNTKKGNLDKVKENKQKQSEIANNKNPKQSEANTDKTDKTQKLNKVAVQNKVTKIPTHNKQTKAVSNVEQKTKTVKSDKPVERVIKEAIKEKSKNTANTENKAAKPNKAKETPVEKIISGNITSLMPTVKVTDKPDDMLSKTVPNKPKTTTATENIRITNKKSNENLTKVKSTENTTKPTKKDDNVATKVTKPQQKVADAKIPKVVTKIPQKPHQIAPVIKASTSKTIENRKSSTVVQNSKNIFTKPKMAQNVVSKIPQKKMTTIGENNRKKFENPLRISPRKQLSTLEKVQQTVSVKQKQAENALRNSPRLLKKPGLPGFKPKSVF